LPKRIKVLVVCFILYGAFYFLLAIVMGLAFGLDADKRLPIGTIARYLLPLAMSILAAATIAAGIGLRLQTLWARPLAIFLALAALLFVPLGTLFGAFALWALSSTPGLASMNGDRLPGVAP